MKLVALVSGGKDSCYAMMECVRHGHEIVCLAHLHPPRHLTPDEAEIDSFMYQSVGHNVVGLIAESMGRPLVSEAITGTALKTDIDYTMTTEGDEVEDLHRLLEKVQRQFPEVQGVCSGAIFSSYQRNRVENVCARLGLISVGYLWRRNQEELLEDMVEAGMEAILVKVAAIGLQPRRHLGRTIGDLQMELLALQEKYQLNVCGEGGEYETLTLDCPLFKKRIVIDASRVVLHSDDFFAPVAFLVVEKCHLEDKPDDADASILRRQSPPPRFVPSTAIATTSTFVRPQVLAYEVDDARVSELAPPLASFRDQFYVGGVMSNKSATVSLEEELGLVFQEVEASLAQAGMTLEDVCFVHLYVRDMGDFARLNTGYCQHFGQYMPPSRSCVELLSLPSRVLMDCFALRGSGGAKLVKPRVMRDVLHIKSISAWAPNCIGPYSQANILHKALILLAGQVAFEPQTMELVGLNHQEQLTQSLRNAGRVLEALESNLRHVCSAVVYITAATSDGDNDEANVGRAIEGACRRLLVSNAGLPDAFENVEDSDESDDEVDKDQERIALAAAAPTLVVQLSHLPRHALVEAELQALTHPAWKHLRPRSSSSRSVSDGWAFEVQQSSIPRTLCHIICCARPSVVSGDAEKQEEERLVCRGLLGAIEQALHTADLPWDRVAHLRVFYVPDTFDSERALLVGLHEVLAEGMRLPALTFVPVEDIQGGAKVAFQITAQDLDRMETDLWLRKQA